MFKKILLFALSVWLALPVATALSQDRSYGRNGSTCECVSQTGCTRLELAAAGRTIIRLEEDGVMLCTGFTPDRSTWTDADLYMSYSSPNSTETADVWFSRIQVLVAGHDQSDRDTEVVTYKIDNSTPATGHLQVTDFINSIPMVQAETYSACTSGACAYMKFKFTAAFQGTGGATIDVREWGLDWIQDI